MKPSSVEIVVAAPNLQAIIDELRNYGWAVQDMPPTIYPAYTVAQAAGAVLGLENATPWCTVGEAALGVADTLRKYMPNEMTFAKAFAMLNDEYAINPKKLNRVNP